MNGSGGEWKEWSQHVLVEIQRLHERQTTLSDTLTVNSQILAVNTEQLKVHIEGVRLAREQNDILKKDVENRLAPIEKHVTQVSLIGKLALIIIGMPATTFFIAQLVRMMMGKI